MSAHAVYVPDGDGRFVASPLARGPWDPAAQHGGAPAALLMRAFEKLPTPDGLALARVTYEFLRPVPLGDLQVCSSVIRPGRRVQLADASIHSSDGAEVVRARALQVLSAEADNASAPDPPPPGPEGAVASDYSPAQRPVFGTDAMEIRFIEGQFNALGPSVGWFRLRVPLVAGEPVSPLQSLAAAGDFGNGISAIVSWDDHLFINPDLTLYIERQPIGEWICLQSETRISSEGVGIAGSRLSDQRGHVGWATQALLVSRR
jgi:hypothetical protein